MGHTKLHGSRRSQSGGRKSGGYCCWKAVASVKMDDQTMKGPGKIGMLLHGMVSEVETLKYRDCRVPAGGLLVERQKSSNSSLLIIKGLRKCCQVAALLLTISILWMQLEDDGAPPIVVKTDGQVSHPKQPPICSAAMLLKWSKHCHCSKAD